MLKGEYMAEELEKWRYPRFFSDTIDENDRIIYMNDEDSKHIAQVLRMRKGDKAIIWTKTDTITFASCPLPITRIPLNLLFSTKRTTRQSLT